MKKTLRQSTLELLGLGSALDIFRRGRLPIGTSELVDTVFGPPGERGAMVISGAGGIVGAGKAMQFGSRLQPYDVPIVALDLPGAPDGLSRQYQGLHRSFGADGANSIMQNIVRLSYDGRKLPASLSTYNPRYLLEAIPENLDMKKDHYAMFRKAFPDVSIWSVTSGFPSAQLGVGIAHPAFPHETNKVWEIVEPAPSPQTQMLWALGLIPMPVSDHWSFVLDVFFCGLTLAGVRYHDATNMPFWKIDKYVRRMLGPNPFRAHDSIGAAGANFLTWSCLHHLGLEYGPLFEPSRVLTERSVSGANWFPMDHFRPLVNWDVADDELMQALILGPLFQMTSIVLHEKRAHLSLMNSIGELCAQFRRGILSTARSTGADEIRRIVKTYHKVHPAAAKTKWYPAEFNKMETPAWQQLYVNAEHDGTAGVITIGRESYNADVDAELNRAIDWLMANSIRRVIISGDFHLSTQMVGADTSDFFPAIEDTAAGKAIATGWSATARRLNNDFDISVGFVHGKRCMGGFLELMTHCHYLIATTDVTFAMPEVTLPVVPGMEGCHWPFRKAPAETWPRLIRMLLEGGSVKAADTVGWLTDFAGPLEAALGKAWELMEKGRQALPMRRLAAGSLNVDVNSVRISATQNPAIKEARTAIARCIADSCGARLQDAIRIQAAHSADFMVTDLCRKGRVGGEYDKVTRV